MKITAIICEYNPFHSGHAYQIREAKKTAGAVVAIMSGSFTQRGLPAILSRYERAKAAIENGADLVLELPFPFCAGSADYFSRGGVTVADSIGVVDALSFGSEEGEIESLTVAASRMNSPAYQNSLSESLKTHPGTSYGRLSFEEYKRLYGRTDLFTGSNNILAVSYIRELKRLGSSIIPETVLRTGDAYNDKQSPLSTSATAVRESVSSGIVPTNLPYVTERSLQKAMEDGTVSYPESLFLPYCSYFRTHSPDDYKDCVDVGDEIAHRFRDAAWNATDFQSFFTFSQTKGFSCSRLYRAALFAFLGVKKEDFDILTYSRVLGATELGRTVLGDIQRKSRIPIITKPADYHGFGIDESYEKGLVADALWLLTLKQPVSADTLIKEHPYMK